MEEQRTIVYDEQLQIEAYQFVGIMQKFPNHFHECYVIGFIEKGDRHLSCRGNEYDMEPGDMLLLNPRDNHTCQSRDGKPLDYRCLNIDAKIMKKAVKEVTGRDYLPSFIKPVAFQSELVDTLKIVHQSIMNKETEFLKEELFYVLIEQLVKEYSNNSIKRQDQYSEPVKLVKKYLDDNFIEQISLDQLSQIAKMDKYTLIRNFTRSYGVTPYQYLETIRVNHAKMLLEKGINALDVAMMAGFSDQSHFTRFFKSLIGLTPKQYQNIFKGEDDE